MLNFKNYKKMNEANPQVLSIAGAQGRALASAWAEYSVVDGISKLINSVIQDGVEVSSTGARLTRDIDANQAAKMIATLSNLTDRETSVRTTVALVVGDLLIDIEASLGEEMYEEILTQVVSESGREKHTVREYKRTCEWLREIFPDGDRPDNLSYTHWNEFKTKSRKRNGEKAISDEKIRELIQVVSQGVVVNAGFMEDGTPFEQRRPLNCAETRALLKEARGESSNPPPLTEPHMAQESSSYCKYRFLYVQPGSGALCSNHPLDHCFKPHEDYFAIDLERGIVIDSSGWIAHLIDINQVSDNNQE